MLVAHALPVVALPFFEMGGGVLVQSLEERSHAQSLIKYQARS